MEKIVHVVNLDIMPESMASGFYTYPTRVFLTEEAAIRWVMDKNPNYPKGYEYICPSEGTQEYHCYTIEPVILEDK